MSITITGEFSSPFAARQAAARLRRRGYIVSDHKGRAPLTGDKLLVAYPYGATGGNTFGNSLLGALPPMAANGITLGNPSTISVLTDDTRSAQARSLMESLGGRIIS